MQPIERMLVPVDFSPGSSEVVRYAFSLLVALKAKPTMDVAHVWSEPTPLGSHDGMPFAVVSWREVAEQAENEAQRQLSHLLEMVDLAEHPRVVRRIIPGVPAQAIVELAERERYDLMVMGTHARKGIAHLLLGSVAEKVLRHAPCPVLIVRQR